MMADIAKHFIAQSRGFLSSDYLPKIERCLEVLTDEDVWRRANEGSNSIGNLLLHLECSTRARIIGVAQTNAGRSRRSFPVSSTASRGEPYGSRFDVRAA